MKLALADWRLPVYGSEAVSFCADYCIDALQIDFGGPGRSPSLNDYKRQEAILDVCVQHNVHIIAVAGNQLNDIGLGTRFDRRDTHKVQNLIVSILDVAHRLSAPLVFFPSFHQGIIRDQATLIRTAKMLRWACKEAHDRQLCLGNENDLSALWAKQLAIEVDAPNFRLIFDCYNPVKSGHRATELLKDLEGYFFPQVHIKDGFAGKDDYIALGSGDGDLAATLMVLFQANWVEHYVLENDYRHCKLQQLDDDLLWITHYLMEVRHDNCKSIVV
jgi:2-epi-5-epi-valiolone 7-phosphate 2-epimerase